MDGRKDILESIKIVIADGTLDPRWTLDNAAVEIKRLRAIVKAGEQVAESHKENNFCCPSWRDTEAKHDRRCPVRAFEEARDAE